MQRKGGKISNVKIAKLFNNSYKPHENYLVLKTTNGEYKYFLISPCREITEKDLYDCRYYKEYGSNAIEAPNYLYRLYGFEKVIKGKVKKGGLS